MQLFANRKLFTKLLPFVVLFNLTACDSDETKKEGENTSNQGTATQSAAATDDLDKLLQTFKNPKETSDTRMNAGMSLMNYKEPRMVPVLMEVIEKDDDYAVATVAIATLKHTDEEKALEVFEKLIKSEGKGMIKSFAINNLAQTNTKKTVPLLIQALKDPDGTVRVGAFKHLGMIHDKQTLPALKEALKNEKKEKVRAFAQGVVDGFK